MKSDDMVTPTILILGHGEIARSLASLADTAGYAVTVCEPGADGFRWPDRVRLVDKVYTDAPWALDVGVHAVVARGHVQDPLSVASLLGHGAERVYLIASNRRATEVRNQAVALMTDDDGLTRLSAPAGLDLGGRSSMQIALSILAEIQWRSAGGLGTCQPLCDGREARARADGQRSASDPCPGKRP